MTLYRVQLKCAVQGGSYPKPYTFSYIWYIDAESVLLAGDRGVALWVDHLKAAHSEYAYCYEVYASDMLEGTDAFTTVPVPAGDQRGTFGTGTTGDWYNPNTAVRIDLAVAGGFPSRKWHRFPLFESWVASGGEAFQGTGFTEALTLAYGGAVGETYVRDESGNGFSGVAIKGIRIKRLGKFAYNDVPIGPAFG